MKLCKVCIARSQLLYLHLCIAHPYHHQDAESPHSQSHAEGRTNNPSPLAQHSDIFLQTFSVLPSMSAHRILKTSEDYRSNYTTRPHIQHLRNTASLTPNAAQLKH
ncbi:hypothetical protein HBI74_051850 [Parastagonospora nodorum]|nr:hypothetical protein HBI74_051850 [Parastagonospora nodorum]